MIQKFSSAGFFGSLSFLLPLAGAVFGIGLAQAESDHGTQAFLDRFTKNPAQAMNELPPKHLLGRSSRKHPVSRFTQAEIKSGDFVRQKSLDRNRFCKMINGKKTCLSDGNKSVIWDNDRPENVVDHPELMINDLATMESRKLMHASLGTSPWSDDYWPMYKGILGARYADDGFPEKTDYLKNRNYVLSPGHTLLDILTAGNATAIDEISPSEKYDLLIGDPDHTMTENMWAQGESLRQQFGKVPTWAGICQGWATAAYMFLRPTHKITLPSADGKLSLNFYPADIKALGSALWAEMSYSYRFIGGKCDEVKPAQDENGRTISQNCFDTNPGTWHQAIVNQIGVAKRGLVIDSSYDYEIWNQPTIAYKYTYFNPKTTKAVATLAEATVPIAEYTNDKFKKYRDANTKSVVGIAMTLTYVAENEPEHLDRDDPTKDELTEVPYVYDLELNQDNQIIGGEWYVNQHPDFLWMPTADAKPSTPGDSQLSGEWDPKTPLPESWRAAARHSSQSSQPLTRVVETMFNLSNQSP